MGYQLQDTVQASATYSPREVRPEMARARRVRSSKLPHYLVAACGWLLLVFEWEHVSHRASRGEEEALILVLIVSLVLIHLAAIIWIAHNKRLAARGKRGLVTRYSPPVFSQDHLGRSLVIESGSLPNREVQVSIDGDSKLYASATPMAGELAVSVEGESEFYASTPVLKG